MSMLVVMGDDMTGCMDVGVQLAKKGYSVSVAVNSDDFDYFSSISNVVIINTQSRNATKEDAFKKVNKIAKDICKSKHTLIYKKVDSTLRGNIGTELDSVLKSYNTDMITFVPALPYNNTITKNGVHYLGSERLTQSDIAKDPFSPVKSSYIPEIIGLQTSLKIKNINLTEVRKGTDCLISKLNNLHKEEVKIAVIDAEEEEDLAVIARAVKCCEANVLAAGSAGLFTHISKNYEKWVEGATDKKFNTLNTHKGFNAPVLIISGSPAKATKLQIEKSQNRGTKVLKLNYPNIDGMKGDIRIYREQSNHWTKELYDEAEIIKETAIEFLRCGKDVIIDGAGQGKEQIYNTYKNDLTILREVSEIIQNILLETFKSLVKDISLSGVMIIGGDTTYHICKGMELRGIRIIDEIEPLVPCGLAVGGGVVQGMPIVTKAGGFGSENIIVKSIEYLKGEVFCEG